MKKLLTSIAPAVTAFVALFSLAIPLFAPVVAQAQTATASASGYCFTTNLGEGHPISSSDATALANILSSQGFWTSGTPITTYTDAVASAVVAYQASVGIPSTGYVGSLTLAKLNSLSGCSSSSTTVTTASGSYRGGNGGGIVRCPDGYTCTPVNQNPTPVCPPQYTCTPIQNPGTGVSATVSLDAASPAASTVPVTNTTNGTYLGLPVLVFDISPQGSSAILSNLVVNIGSPVGGSGGTIAAAYLYQGASLISSAAVVNGSAQFTNLSNASSPTIAPNTSMPYTVKVDVSGVTSGPGFTVSASVIGSVLSPGGGVTLLEGTTNVVMPVSGSAQGNTITVVGSGPAVSLTGTPSITSTVSSTNPNTGAITYQYTATFNVNVTAVGESVTLGLPSDPNPAFYSVYSPTSIVETYINGVVSPVSGMIASYSAPSGTTINGTSFTIAQNQTVTIPVTYSFVVNNPGANVYGVQLLSMDYSDGVGKSSVSIPNACTSGANCSNSGPINPSPVSGSVNAVNHAGNPDTVQGLIWVYWPSLGSGYTYTVSASPSYTGSVESTTYTNSIGQSGLNMGCSSICYNGGGAFPTNGPYTFTVTAVGPNGQTVNVGTSNAETVSNTSQPVQSFTVTSPSAGEVLQVGQAYKIIWTGIDPNNPTGLPNQVNLDGGSLGNTGTLSIANNVPVTTQLVGWLVPSTVQPATNYQICIGANIKGGSGGCSQPFTIVSAASTTASVTVNGTPTLALTYNSAQQESALTATFNVSVNGGSQGVNILDGAPAISFIDQNGNTAEVNLSNVTLVPTAGSNVSTEEDSYGQPMAIVPAGQTVNFTASATANPQQIFAGTYHAMLYAVAANPTTNINNEFELQAPANQTNAVTIVGELSPYITSVSPNPATVGQTLTINGQRLGGATNTIYIDSQALTNITVNTAPNGTSLSFTLPLTSSQLDNGGHSLWISNPSVGKSNVVNFQVTGNTTPTPPVITGTVTAVNHSQNPATSQGLIYVSWPSQGSGYTYTITASPSYTGSVETTTHTGINMGCYVGGCFNGGGAFPANGPYTFTVTATGPNGTFTVGTSNSEMVSPVSSTAVCPAGYTCVPVGSSLTCPAGYTCTNVTANCPTGYTCQTTTAISTTPTTQPSVTISSPSAGQTFAYGAPIPVTWGENYNSPTITVYLYSPTAGNVFTSPIINGTTGTTNLYTIPATAVNSIPTTGGQYEVNVCDNNQSPAGLSGKSLCSLSGTFTISPTVVSTPPPASSATVTAINHSQNPATSQGLIYVSWPSQGSGYTYTVSANPSYTGSVETTTHTGINMGCYVGGCFNGGGAFPGNGPYTFTVTATDANGNTTTIGTSNAETVSPATTSTATTQSSSVWQSFMNLLGF